MKRGDKGAKVAALQVMLNLVLASKKNDFIPLVTDGDFGGKTEAAVGLFCGTCIASDQSGYKVADSLVVGALQNEFAKVGKLVVVLDAGHGGLDPVTGEYTTPADNGKRWQHPGELLHTPNGWFFEGWQNRLAVKETVRLLKEKNIFCVVASHEYLDWNGTKSNSEELKRRGNFAAAYYANGCNVIFHSIHSNAAPTSIKDPKTGKTIRKRTQAELDAITGIENYTVEADDLSDVAVKFLVSAQKKRFPDVNFRSGGIKEADFMVIKEAKKCAETNGCKYHVEVLSEDFVYTSKTDAKRLCLTETTKLRAEAYLEFYETTAKTLFK